MLPKLLPDETVQAKRMIYINPNFRNISQMADDAVVARRAQTHVNPLFLNAQRKPAIHMNPQFLLQKQMQQQILPPCRNVQHMVEDPSQYDVIASETDQKEPRAIIAKPINYKISNASTKQPSNIENFRKIISKTRTRIIREPLVQKVQQVKQDAAIALQPLIKLSNRKLVRYPANSMALPSSTIVNANKTKLTAHSTMAGITATKRYKIDRRSVLIQNDRGSSSLLKIRHRPFVARYALRRAGTKLPGKSKISSSSTSKTTPFKDSPLPLNKKLQLLNINGVLYRSTRNKLQLKDANYSMTKTKTISKSNITNSIMSPKQHVPVGRAVYVSGTKFILDAQGFKLTRVPKTSINSLDTQRMSSASNATQRKRIDIGGLTYVASKTQNVYVRTSTHLALAHVTNAKHRSLQLLTRRLVKSNLPCAIFQRLGKCAAYERGKCAKVHDKLRVTVCPRFLRGECLKSDCLLSHNVSLSKMPACKFFLQGVCVRNDCPYLHKKLSPNAEVCEDFLRGFCRLAEECNKRHEFVCPEFERTGKCKSSNCIHCKRRQQQEQQHRDKQQKSTPTVLNTSIVLSGASVEQKDQQLIRYFDSSNATLEPADQSQAALPADDVSDSDEMDVTMENNSSIGKLSRPKVGILPAFIPLT